MAPELFPSVPGAVSGMNRKEAEDRVTEKVRPRVCGAPSAQNLHSAHHLSQYHRRPSSDSLSKYYWAMLSELTTVTSVINTLSPALCAAGGCLLIWCCSVGDLDTW